MKAFDEIWAIAAARMGGEAALEHRALNATHIRRP
jgi:hypothetical protein